MKRNLVFDLDGTLVDPSTRDHRLYSTALREQGIEPLDFASYWPLRRKPTHLETLLNVQVTAADVWQFMQSRLASGEHIDALASDTLFDNVHHVLQQCRANYDCHILTSRYNQETTLAQVEKLGLSKYFVSVRALGTTKLKALSEMNHVHAMIGDTEHDVNPAKELGIMSIAVTTGIRSREFLESLRPDHVFDDIIDILGVL
jgi:phosphoglycolate phosphatase-like HAD superfamily hydrolase